MQPRAYDCFRSVFSAKFALAATATLALAFGIRPAHSDVLTFQDVINPGDATFNQALGINSSGEIAGYFGSGAAGHPNKGYTTNPPYTSFTPENFPGSVQTQVTGINDLGNTVGFYSFTNMGVGLDSNFAFVNIGGTFSTADNPGISPGPPPLFDQLLGINNSNLAVGFYTDAAGNTHGYTFNANTLTSSGPIDASTSICNAGTTTTAAINNSGQIAGTCISATTGLMEGFLDNMGTFTAVPSPVSGANVMLTGLNDNDLAVGVETLSSGAMYGLICNTLTLGCLQVNDPNSTPTPMTTFNGINDKNQIVGFYVNAAGDTIGLVTNGVVPEPSYFGLIGCGLAGFGALRFWRRRRAS
jgi:hypothetical protein